MKTLKAPNIKKPDFVSDVSIKVRPEIKVVSLAGMGDPLETFDHKVSEVFAWLGDKWVRVGNTLGVYYKDRRNVGVENVEWDACVPVDKEVKTEGELKYQVLLEKKVASLTLTGGYDLIGPALKYLEAVTEANGIKTSWPLTEVYLEEGERPVTELQYLVKE